MLLRENGNEKFREREWVTDKSISLERKRKKRIVRE